MRTVALLATILALASSGCGTYGTPAQTASRPPLPAQSAPPARISAAQLESVRAYYADAGPPRGRGRGRGGLPPGIERNLQRGKPLPPGIAKRYLPPDVLAGLPRAPDGLEYVLVGGKLLLVEIATQVVREVLLEAVFD